MVTIERMQFFLCSKVGGAGLLGSVVLTEVDEVASSVNAGNEFLTIGVCPYGQLVMFAPPPSGVLHLFASGRLAQIAPTVVVATAVDVVDLIDRITSSDQFPNEPMSAKVFPIQDDYAMASIPTYAVLVEAACGLAGVAFIPTTPFAEEMRKRPFFPGEFASVGVVVKALAKIALLWQGALSHVGLHLGSLVRAVSALAASWQPAFVYTTHVAEMQA